MSVRAEDIEAALAGLGQAFPDGAVDKLAALLGELADQTSIATVFQWCAFLPAIGLLTWFLPDIRKSS